MNRRAILKLTAAAPALAFPAYIGAPPSDATVVAAWRRACELERFVNEETEGWSDDEVIRLVDSSADDHEIIALLPCHTPRGVAVKLRLLLWLKDNGSTAEWETDLIRTALVALERIAPEGRL